MVNNAAQDLFTVNGMVAVVTGGGSGLGLYAARALDANGAKAVYIAGRRENVLQEAAKTAKNGKIIPVVCDVTDKASLSALTEKVRKEQGYCNFLFANAGIMGPPSRKDMPAADANGKLDVKGVQDALWNAADMDAYTKTFHVNSTATFYAAVAFMDLLDAGNKARNVPQDSQILVTSSIAGYSRYLASSFAYSASKASITHTVKMLATFFSQSGIRIRANVVVPGLYPSEMTVGMVKGLDKVDKTQEGNWEDAHAMPRDRCPGERTGSEEDFAGTILFMAGKAGAYLNGETLVTDGGRLSQLPGTY